MTKPAPAPAARVRIPSATYIYVFGALGGFLFGFDTGILAGALPFIKKDLPNVSATESGLIVAALAIGAVLGAAVCGRLSDRIGRRRTLFVLGGVFVVGSIASALATSGAMLIACRAVLGLGVGGASALVPVYLAEMAPAHVRGRLGGLNQLMIVVGILAGYLVNLAFDPTGDWRLMLGTGLIPSAALVLGAIRLPESPRWLVENSRREEAFTLLASTRPVEEARAEIEQIERIVAQPVDRHELRARWVRPALVVGIGLAILTQLSGNNVISYYAPTILTGLGLGSSVAILATVGLGAVKVIFVVFGLALIDKVGRKALLIIGSLGMGLSLVGLAIAAQAAHPNPALLVFFMALFLAANEIGWGPTFWVLMGEIFPLRVRGAAMGMSSMTVWVATAVVSFAFPPMLAGIGLSTSMWVFAVFNLLAVLFGWRFVRETKGRTLEAIELELQTAGNAIIEPAQPVTAAGPRTEAAAARDAKGQA